MQSSECEEKLKGGREATGFDDTEVGETVVYGSYVNGSDSYCSDEIEKCRMLGVSHEFWRRMFSLRVSHGQDERR